jgi:hypothetical protein
LIEKECNKFLGMQNFEQNNWNDETTVKSGNQEKKVTFNLDSAENNEANGFKKEEEVKDDEDDLFQDT